MIIKCPACNTTFNVRDDKVPKGGGKLRCFNCKEVFVFQNNPEERSLILIANENKDFCQSVAGLLEANGYKTEMAFDGVDALIKIQGQKTKLALLDVALPRMFGFDVCETIKNDNATKDTKIILIAAIYDKTRYKRLPNSLYGADDYIEKHHIHDDLVAKIRTLIPDGGGGKAAIVEPSAVTPEPYTPPAVENALDKTLEQDFSDMKGEEHEKAKRLARIIVSDIALYNEEILAEGIKNNNCNELLKDDLEEGRKLFRQRVPKEVWEKRDYLSEFFEEFIEKHSLAP